jgi:hypothetical protein
LDQVCFFSFFWLINYCFSNRKRIRVWNCDATRKRRKRPYLHLYPPITYYWTVPLILDHSYLVGKLTRSKIADTKMSGF